MFQISNISLLFSGVGLRIYDDPMKIRWLLMENHLRWQFSIITFSDIKDLLVTYNILTMNDMERIATGYRENCDKVEALLDSILKNDLLLIINFEDILNILTDIGLHYVKTALLDSYNRCTGTGMFVIMV